MTELRSSLQDELFWLADELDEFSERIGTLASEAIPSWITVGDPQRPPINWDGHGPLFIAKKYARRESELVRNLWLCREDENRADLILEAIRGIGEKLGQITDEAKAVVYVTWCRHFLTRNDPIANALVALFPSDHCGFLAGILGTKMSRVCDGSRTSRSQLDMPNLAEALQNAARVLSARLRTDSEPIGAPEDEFCCSIGDEEEHHRPKRPDEILPRIVRLRSK